MNIQVFQTNQELNKVGAEIITGLVHQNPSSSLGLATGGTPVGIYEEIVRIFQMGLVSFRQVTTFNLDEYVGLPENHPESYRCFMRKHLFKYIDLPPNQAHLPDGNASNLEQECQRYDHMLEEAGQIDLQLLGIGHNGHIGFNEPNQVLSSGTHVVELREETRQANARFFHSLREVPTQAITIGINSILKAKSIMLVVRGADKAEVVHRALTGPVTTDCPASLLQTHPNLTVLLDESAGRLLT